MALRKASIVMFAALLLYGPRTSTGIVALATLPSVMVALNNALLVLCLLLVLVLKNKRLQLKKCCGSSNYKEQDKNNKSSRIRTTRAQGKS